MCGVGHWIFAGVEPATWSVGLRRLLRWEIGQVIKVGLSFVAHVLDSIRLRYDLLFLSADKSTVQQNHRYRAAFRKLDIFQLFDKQNTLL